MKRDRPRLRDGEIQLGLRAAQRPVDQHHAHSRRYTYAASVISQRSQHPREQPVQARQMIARQGHIGTPCKEPFSAL